MWGRDTQEKKKKRKKQNKGKNPELKRWRKEVREKKWPDLNFRKNVLENFNKKSDIGSSCHPITSGILVLINKRKGYLEVLCHKTRITHSKGFQEIVKL